MSQLESVLASSGESPLIDSLDFSLPPASTSIVDRRQHVRAYPTSASSLSVNGTRTVRIRLGGDEFVDPQSIRLQFTIVNGDATRRLVTTGGPGVFGNRSTFAQGTVSSMISRSMGASINSTGGLIYLSWSNSGKRASPASVVPRAPPMRH